MPQPLEGSGAVTELSSAQYLTTVTSVTPAESGHGVDVDTPLGKFHRENQTLDDYKGGMAVVEVATLTKDDRCYLKVGRPATDADKALPTRPTCRL